MMIIGASSALGLSVAAADEPAEPEDLDEPTPWQEGDPQPVEMKVPAMESEQSSSEAPPSRPMDDERPAPPGPNYVWATGYWWWTGGRYVWVPGYWAVPPQAGYVYVAGYWGFRGAAWVYVRGGWGRPNTSVVVVHPGPRPLLAAWVIGAPFRIARRHRHWRHYHARLAHHRVVHHAHGHRGRNGRGRHK